QRQRRRDGAWSNSINGAYSIILSEEEAGACMQQWEYIIVDVRLWRSGEQVYINGHPVERLAPSPNRLPGEEDSAAPTLYEVLEWLGKNGWELTGIAPDEHYSKLFFKRPRPPKNLP